MLWLRSKYGYSLESADPCISFCHVKALSLIHILLSGAAVAFSAGNASAQGLRPDANTQSQPIGFLDSGARESAQGTTAGLTWTARGYVVGTTSTAAPGDPIYYASMPAYSGVAAIRINTFLGDFICTGSLLSDRRSVLTAAHCISDDSGNLNANSATAYFYDGSAEFVYNPNTNILSSPFSTAIDISDFFIAPNYSGAVIEDDDIAVLRLRSEAPSFAASYELSPVSSLRSQPFNVAGYGDVSTQGGSVGVNQGAGLLRQGDNRYDYEWGDPNFNGFFAAPAFFPEGLNTWISDFDSGFEANDAACRVARAVNSTLANDPMYCNTGVGAREVSISAGDSGGPGFIDGQIVTVNSYGLSFGTDFGDSLAGLNSSFGEFNGYVPVSTHRNFIQSVMVQSNIQSVPAPIPLFGVASMVAWSRRLKRKSASTR